MIVVGLMSGTSADGVDAAVVRLQGAPPRLEWELLGFVQHPHPQELRQSIFAAFRPETSSAEHLCRLNFELGEAFAAAALQAIRAAGLTPSQVDFIGSHGQTVWHIPPAPGETASTLQLGEPAVIAERSGLPAVSNFRARDMAAGGQGAPLVPFVDWLLLTHPTKTRVAQNIGGIGNLTYLPPEGRPEEILAFDTGPGNMLLDDAARRATDGRLTFDRDGLLAAAGKVNTAWLKVLLSDPYFSAPPPKSTGRERFGAQLGAELWQNAGKRGLSAQDILATLTAFTAESIALSYQKFLPRLPEEVIVSGGGSLNPTLMQRLRQRLAPAHVLVSDEIGLPSAAKEALAFAVLAYETWHHRPANLSSATGAKKPVVLGSVTWA